MSDLGNKAVFAANLKRLMTERRKTQAQICKELGFSPTTFNSWCTAYAYPRIDKIEKIADYFGVLKSDLIENKTNSENLKSEIDPLMVNIYKKMDSATKEELLKYANYLLAQQKKDDDTK